MTDTNPSLNEVVALLDERRRYENWLAALEARRDSTPVHVFERVQTDYRSRLTRVDGQIELHRHTIEEERTSVQSRLSFLQAEERTRRDERAELELRAHVGELVGDEAVAAFRSVDDAIRHLTAEKGALRGRVVELENMLAPRWTPADAATAAVEGGRQPVAAKPASVVENNDVAPIEEPVSETPASQPPTEDEAATSRTPAGSFDELAYLNNVVGSERSAPLPPIEAQLIANSRAIQPGAEAELIGNGRAVQPGPEAQLIGNSRGDSSMVRTESATESLLAGLSDTPSRASATVPLAANVPANTPIVLKSTSSVEQVKTLKCSECGAMNYPTEWYCERCGAELAAL